MFYLQVYGCGYYSYDVVFSQVESRGVYEVQEDVEFFGVDFWIQIDYIKVVF